MEGEVVWEFDGNHSRPTFSPSLLNQTSRTRCHLHLRDGVLEFLSDCTHDLAGKSVQLTEEHRF